MNTENFKGRYQGGHAGREDLTGEHRLGDIIQLMFVFLFLTIWILDSFVLKYSTFLAGSVPGYIGWTAGIILFIIGSLLARSGLKSMFGTIQESPHVINSGVFSIVRHPIYLGAILFYTGLVFLTLSLASAVMLLVIIAFYRFISRYEEKLLTLRFGDEYREYMRKVPMLFPIKIKREK